MKIKKGDNVKVMRGKDKGRTGKILQVFPKTDRVVIEGANLRFRHLRPRRANEKGQRVTYPASLSASNVMKLDSKTGKPTRSDASQTHHEKTVAAS